MRNRTIPHVPEADRAFVRSLLIHEDAALLAFDKPAGLPSQVRGNRARNLDHLLWAFARSNGKRPRLVHRLDSGTSGVIVAAKTKPAAVALSGAFERREVEKTYLALASGELPDAESGRIDAPIARIETDRGTRIECPHPEGKPACTGWRILSRVGRNALFELTPGTGRMHQLRLHLRALGCPIRGDTLYNGAPAGRLMLHAMSLAGPHPDGGRFKLAATLPDSFRDAAEALGLTDGLAQAGRDR